ncbi:TonB-dependent receptor [Sandaracinobacteroides saxicola]|uniref:TonB-dependent receptor n=1 Tax=Sandaracinobacteroides saxicola TaxID=2759707 RepID=A0A7G5IIS5_9SPHN|nr:TonB-dependent receptor [Sandaracinobacteroides saxicola]QMW23267.1 TonB-dependent receptor [Sandaracinobacteroides saxicola]
MRAIRQAVWTMVSSSALATALASSAVAQTAPASQVDDGAIADIVVTAQRREESLQRVPLSITAVTGEALREANVTDVNRIEQLVPGVRIGRSGSDARPAIRGVYTEAIGANSDPRIGFYIDDIYQSRTSQALTGFVDLERVEVQKGPQGTLYGRNSFGGNIAIYSTVPKDEFAAGFDALYGRFNRARFEGFINQPLGPSIAFRLAGSYERQDGYVKNSSTGSDLGDEDAGYVRGILKIAPVGSGLEVQLRGSYYKQGGAGISAFGYKSIGTLVAPNLVRAPGGSIALPNGRVLTFTNGFNGQAFPTSLGSEFRAPFNSRFRDGIPDIGGADVGVPIEADPWKINFDARVTRRTEQKQFSGVINYDFDTARIRSITSYTDFNALRQSDNDFSSVPIAIDSNLTKVKTFTQELQLLSNDTTSPFQWIIGGFYYNDKVEEIFFSDNFTNYPVAGQPALSTFGISYLPGAAFPANTPLSNIRSDNFAPVLLKTKSYAGFAQLSYTFFDKLRLTAGYRYTSDQKRYAAGITSGAAGGGFLAFDLNQRVNYTCPAPGATTALFGNNPASPQSTATNAANALGIQCGERDFNFHTWRGAIDYQFTRDNMVYGSVSRGIRSGGFNNVLNTVTGQVLPFEPEVVTAYELGTKNRLADGKVQLNAAVFYNDFKQLQVQNTLPAPNGLTTVSIITNAGKSRAYGIELDAIVKPTRRLTFQASFNYLNAKDTDLVFGTQANGICSTGVLSSGGCVAVPAYANPAAPTAAEIAAVSAALAVNAVGVGPQGAAFPNVISDPNRFRQVFITLPNGTVVPATQTSGGATLPVYNYVIGGKGADGTTYVADTPLSPKYVVQVGVSYDLDVAGGTLTPSVQTYFSSSFINAGFTPNFGNQPAFTRTDMRLSWVSGDEKFRVQAYVENLENAAVLNRVAFGANRSLNGVFGTPRTYGIKAGVRF